MHTIPDELSEPFTRLWVEQPQLAAFMFESGIYLIEDAEDNPTAKTDGARWIRVNPGFMRKCRSGEEGAVGADIFVLAHEIMHCSLMHNLWMDVVYEHGILLTSRLVEAIRRFNPVTKWREGMVIPAAEHEQLVQWALDFVINDTLYVWGMKITPYRICHDKQIATYLDDEATVFCRLIGKHMIEPDEAGSSSAKNGSRPGAGSSSPQGGSHPGDGGSDMVRGYVGDLPDEAEAEAGPLDLQRRRMSIETLFKEVEAAMKARGDAPLGMDRVLDRILPSRLKYRQFITQEIKALGRGWSTWSRLSPSSYATGRALPGKVGKRTGTLVFQCDVSGSVGLQEMMQVAGVAVDATTQLTPKRIIVLDVDARVQQVREPKSPAELRRVLLTGFKGGGGTDMRKGFEWCRDNLKEKHTVITVTDGGTPWPTDHQPAERALWVITVPGVKAPEAAGVSVYMPLEIH